jgi:tRNA threonylcarbamoyladenosine biosynthesis protein TsaE
MSIFDELAAGVVSSSPEDTSALAERLAMALPEDAILALQGDLGAGKTTWVKAMAKTWGIEQTVKSPTFNLVSIYKGQRQLVHVDAYRLESPEALDGLMLDEFLQSPFCLIIEWPERIQSWLPPNAYWLKFEIESAARRRMQLTQLHDF